MIELIQCIEASDIPQELEDFCVDQEWSMHYSSELCLLDHTDENAKPFIEWFISIGGKLDENDDSTCIGIWGT